jgi:hypothetical protein
LGLTEFNPKPLFESAMMSQFASRFSKEDMGKINEEIYRRTRRVEDNPHKQAILLIDKQQERMLIYRCGRRAA